MNDFSHTASLHRTGDAFSARPVGASQAHDALSCGVDCYVRQASRKGRCFCDFLAAVDACLNEGELQGRDEVETAGGLEVDGSLARAMRDDLALPSDLGDDGTASASGIGYLDPGVRLIAAERSAEAELAPFLDDPDGAVRERAYVRLVAVSRSQINRLMDRAANAIQAEDRIR
ncbi:hypothetical protein [Breoghania sp.]|uniref:hypothetical protein n=1 Tax=Breoghania sp. TaxID=2065378 RepID=UPI00260A820D|nr:hypothetical protein [Breoghania sp.]MDJ0931300.1 hypothetical protein [Breoghania sp.]